jgi:hypothetical protein
MAEVRQIPSAVGAFEAQVFDMSKTYRTIMAQNAAAQKRQAQAQKDIEKQMDISLSDKRLIRPQDTDAIEEAKMEAYNYYYNNRDKVNTSSAAMNELKTRMGKFTALVSESNALKKQGDAMNPVLKQALDPKNEMDEGLVDALDMWNKPINDPTRQKATFMRNGVATNINEFNISDLTYFEKFNEAKDLDAAITTNVKPYTKTSMDLSRNKKLGIYVDETTQLKIYDDSAIVNSVITAATSPKSRGFMSTFDQQLKMYNSFPKEDRDLEFKSVVDAYRDLTGSDITRHFRKEGGEGIDTPLEFAAFKKLQEKLPQVVKDTYDYRTQNALLGKWRYGLSQSKFNYEKAQNETLDEDIIKSIKSGKFKASDWNSYMKPLTNIGHPSLASVRAGDINFSEPDARGNITITYETNTPILDDDGNILKSNTREIDADARLSKVGGAKAKLSGNGEWYASKTKTYIVNAKDPALPTKVSTVLDEVRNAIPIDEVGSTWDALRKRKTELQQQTPAKQGKTQPTTKVTKTSTSVNMSNKTLNR